VINYELSDDRHGRTEKKWHLQVTSHISSTYKHVNEGHTSSKVGIQSSKPRSQPKNKICIPALGDDDAPELSAFAKLYPRLAEEACRRIISGTKFLQTSKFLS
jgi:hypothetical protein